MKHNERKSKYGLYIRLILHTNCFDHRFDSHERIMAAKWHDEKSCWCQDIENAKLKVCSQINEYIHLHVKVQDTIHFPLYFFV
jgi:hypothetical protein